MRVVRITVMLQLALSRYAFGVQTPLSSSLVVASSEPNGVVLIAAAHRPQHVGTPTAPPRLPRPLPQPDATPSLSVVASVEAAAQVTGSQAPAVYLSTLVVVVGCTSAYLRSNSAKACGSSGYQMSPMSQLPWEVLPMILWLGISAFQIQHFSWQHGFARQSLEGKSSSQAAAFPRLLDWNNLGLPSDPLNLADTSWSSCMDQLRLIIFFGAVHLAGSTALRSVLPALEIPGKSGIQIKVTCRAAWALTCTVAMLLTKFEARQVILPLSWALVAFTLVHCLVGRVEPTQNKAGDTCADRERAGANPAAGRILVVPWIIHCSIFAVIGPHVNDHYGVATFFFLIRLLSYSIDVLELNAGCARSGLAGVDLALPLNAALFVEYVFYPPLYVLGPLTCFSEFAQARLELDTQHLSGEGFANSSASLQSYAAPGFVQDIAIKGAVAVKLAYELLRLVGIFAIFSLLRHAIWPTAVARYLIEVRPGNVSVWLVFSLAYWFVLFAWFRWLLCWRLCRIWAEADGIPAPENVRLCPLSCTSLRSLWRRWHVSLYSFLQRYIYLPLGGSRVPWVPLNVALVFAFVGFVYQPKQDVDALRRHGVPFAFFAVAVVLEMGLRRLHDIGWVGQTVDTLISSVLLGVCGMLAFTAVVGVAGFQDLLSILEQVQWTRANCLQLLAYVGVVFTFFCALRTQKVDGHSSDFVCASGDPCAEPAASLAQGLEERSAHDGGLAAFFDQRGMHYSTESCTDNWPRRLALLPPALLIVGMAGAGLMCLRLRDWHWERYKPFLEEATTPSGFGTNESLWYSSCEHLRLDSFVRAPSNSCSSIFMVLVPAYVLYRVPFDLPRAFDALVVARASEPSWNFVQAIYGGSFVTFICLAFSSFLFHASVTKQALHFDIMSVMNTFGTLMALHVAVLLMPTPPPRFPSEQTEANTVGSIQDALTRKPGAGVLSSTFSVRQQNRLLCLSSFLVLWYATVFANLWHQNFKIVVGGFAVSHPIVAIAVAKYRAHTRPRAQAMLRFAAFLGVLALVAKVLDDREAWLQIMVICKPFSVFQMTATMHMLYGVASFIQFAAERELLLAALGVPLEAAPIRKSQERPPAPPPRPTPLEPQTPRMYNERR